MKYKILIADDDRDFVKTLRSRLEIEGYETLCAYEGVRAVELAHREKPNIILLDWRMPAGTGETVLKNLADKDDTRGIPVVVITGYNDPDISNVSKNYGVKATLHKPYDQKELLDVIKGVLSQPHV